MEDRIRTIIMAVFGIKIAQRNTPMAILWFAVGSVSVLNIALTRMVKKAIIKHVFRVSL